MNRFWLLEDRLATSQELRRAGVSRLRAADLGRCKSIAAAREKATKHLRRAPAAIMAHNVRLACDSGRGARWGLTGEQIARLRNGERLALEDSLGRFSIGYSTPQD